MGKKRPNTVRTMISVPRDLKQRMSKVKEEVNWSAIACQAFAGKLAEIASRKELKDMSDVIERLRASTQRASSEEFRAGCEAGQKWAKNRAEAIELQRLEEFQDALEREVTTSWNAFFCDDPHSASSAYTVAEKLFFVIQPECQGDREGADAFWRKAGDKLSPEFLRGFGEGALAVWSAVKGQL